MFRIKSVRMRTIISILPVTILLLVILSVASYFAGKNTISKEIDTKIQNKMDGLNVTISSRLNSHARVAESLANTVEVTGATLNKNQYQDLVEKYAAMNEDTFGAGIWYEPYKYKTDIKLFGPYAYKDSGKILYTEDYMTEEYNFPNQDWYKAGRDSKEAVGWTAPFYDDATKVTMVTAAVPFHDKNGTVLGATSTDMDLVNLQKIVNDLKIGSTGKAFLLTADGTYIAGVDESRVMKAKLSDDKQFASVSKDILSGKSGNENYKDGNDSRVVYYSPIGDTKWILGITVSNSEQFKSLQSLLITISVFSIILIVLITLNIILFSNYITRSIGRVNKLTSIVSSGDLTYEMEVTSEDELGVMSKNLNKMSSELKTTFKDIVNSLDNIVGTSEELTASSEQTQSSAEQVGGVMRALANGSENQALESKDILDQVTHIYDGIKGI